MPVCLRYGISAVISIPVQLFPQGCFSHCCAVMLGSTEAVVGLGGVLEMVSSQNSALLLWVLGVPLLLEGLGISILLAHI